MSDNSSVARIGLRVISSTGWQGGVNYVANWARMCASVPQSERPEIWLLPFDERGNDLVEPLARDVAGVHPFQKASELDLDMVFPATQIFEAPFDAPWAAWIPDWQCKHFPELFDETERMRRDLHYELLATKSPMLVLSSQIAVDDSLRLFADRLVRHRKQPFGSMLDEETQAISATKIANAQRQFDIADRFFFVANQWWKHKNHEVILRAMQQVDDPDLQIVFTGALKDHRWPDFPESLLADLPEATKRRTRILGSVDREIQLALMLSAQAIIQPSRFEGWSTVVEEARTLSLPILLSDIHVHREQAPPLGRFFGVDDAAGLAELLREFMNAPHKKNPARAESRTNEDYRRHCVATLCSIARETRALYHPIRHDPALLLADFTGSCMDRGYRAAQPALFNKVISGTRSMLASNRGAAERYQGAIESKWPDFRLFLREHVVQPALAKAHK